MVSKVLICPVGIYLERVWKSIVRSGADKIYLISDTKPEYRIIKEVRSRLEERIKNLNSKVIKKEADFSSLEDIYRVFVGIIERERAENPYVRIQIDLSSTTKMAWHVASNLAASYGLTLTYVPGVKKLAAETIKKRYETQKDDPGGDVQELTPALFTYKEEPLSKDEVRVLYKIENKYYESVNRLIEELADDEGKEFTKAYEKRFLRVVHDLEEKKLVSGMERGRVKVVRLTGVGRGVVKGLREADKCLKEEGLKSLIESLYV